MLSSVIGSPLTVGTFLLCTAVSLALGVGVALLAMFRTRCSRSFALTVALLPAVVQIVIMLVNGNIGAGVAVAGAFGLVRFRSAPGTAREIAAIFLGMALGLATGMGYVVVAGLFFVLIAAFWLLLSLSGFGKRAECERLLKVTIPEDLDYDGLFDDIFAEYLHSFSLERVKTSGMGTLYELQYRIVLREAPVPKAFLDALRARNGNLTIVCCKESDREQL